MDQRQIDKQDTYNSIDRLIDKYGEEMLAVLNEKGVLVEGQFYMGSGIFKRELSYLEKKLSQMGLSALIASDEEELEYQSQLVCRYYPGTETEGNYFYYAIYYGHSKTMDKNKAEQVAIQIFRDEILNK
ncbi:hypothetical protein COA05_20480 [Bacillus thuringiensis]|uniref:hypothetical protein n=1 Tax=Bacillus thuringiensis TaxID=1428 RepID=UPI000BFE287B|nr:hypothetical protein [Bacillus thuringiensis]PGQ29253.1 hypothetical protein COA05_20480 [Bacillus thuringiensis]